MSIRLSIVLLAFSLLGLSRTLVAAPYHPEYETHPPYSYAMNPCIYSNVDCPEPSPQPSPSPSPSPLPSPEVSEAPVIVTDTDGDNGPSPQAPAQPSGSGSEPPVSSALTTSGGCALSASKINSGFLFYGFLGIFGALLSWKRGRAHR